MLPPRARTVATLGTAQTLAWASTYYLPAILAAPMARDLGVAVPTVFAAFSLALVVSALLGPHCGPCDRPLGRTPRAQRHERGVRGGPGAARDRAVNGRALHRLGAAGLGMGSGLYEGGVRGAGAPVRP